MWLGRSTDRLKPLVEPDAYSGFYENTHLDVFRYLMAMLKGDQDEAEDITAEAYLRGWNHRHGFEGSLDAAFGWILTIARRILIDRYRAASNQAPGSAEETVSADDLPDPLPTAEEMVVDQERTESLLESLQCLPVAQREALILRYVLDWRVNRIAEYLQVSENTASVTIGRALKRIQPILARPGGSDE